MLDNININCIDSFFSWAKGKKIEDLLNIINSLDFQGENLTFLNNHFNIGFGVSLKNSFDFAPNEIFFKFIPVILVSNTTYQIKKTVFFDKVNLYEFDKDFEHSMVCFQNDKTWLVLCEWNEKIPEKYFKIINIIKFDINSNDNVIIKNDWNLIKNEIRYTKCYNQTLYLSFSQLGLENPDAYSCSEFILYYNYSFLNYYINNKLLNTRYQSIFVPNLLNNQTNFLMALENKIHQFKNYSVIKLVSFFNLNLSSKSLNEQLCSKMFGVTGKINNCEEFVKSQIKCKTIRVKENNRIVESISFPAFKFCEIVKETWNTSTLRNFFMTTKFLFIVFKEHNNGFYFEKIVLWSMNPEEIDNIVKAVWMKTVQVIRTGNIVSYIDINGNRKTNFPGIAFNSVIHVRPHASNANDTFPLPVQDVITGLKEYTKQCFWINNTFVEGIIT